MATSFHHFTHLPHSLTEVSEDKEFKCDGCGRLGIGQRYRCQECNFNLHMHCGHCPTDLSSFIHPKHRLHMALEQRPRIMFREEHNCEVCGEKVRGLFYQCKRCEIYVHPLCSQLPQYVRLKTDIEHSLELQRHEDSNSCAVCGETCSCWYYRCGTCPVVLHIDCLLSMLLPLKPPPLKGSLVHKASLQARVRGRVPPPLKKKKVTFSLSSSSSKDKRSTVAWWLYALAFVMTLQVLYLVMRF